MQPTLLKLPRPPWRHQHPAAVVHVALTGSRGHGLFLETEVMNANFVAFTPVAVGMIILPGADFTVVVRNSLEGRVRGALTGVGVALGLVLHTVVAVMGLAAVVAASPGALAAIQYAGAAYLLYLGLKTMHTARQAGRAPPRTECQDAVLDTLKSRFALRNSILQGFLTNALNPKAPLLFLSLMPQFVPTGGPMSAALIMMSLIVVAIGLVWFPGIALIANRLTRVVNTQERRSMFDSITGALLVILAIAVAVK
jgi:threonine/homoserine/homoserine lactone efflux protein